jgi:hypothetical protein
MKLPKLSEIQRLRGKIFAPKPRPGMSIAVHDGTYVARDLLDELLACAEFCHEHYAGIAKNQRVALNRAYQKRKEAKEALGKLSFLRFTQEEKNDLSGQVVLMESQVNDIEDWLIERSKKIVESSELDILREIESHVRGYGPRQLWPLFEKLDAIRGAK